MSTYQSQSVNHKTPELVDSGYWADIRFDPSSDAPNYIGLNISRGASTASPTWKILSIQSTRIQIAYGAWDDRATLFP